MSRWRLLCMLSIKVHSWPWKKCFKKQSSLKVHLLAFFSGALCYADSSGVSMWPKGRMLVTWLQVGRDGNHYLKDGFRRQMWISFLISVRTSIDSWSMTFNVFPMDVSCIGVVFTDSWCYLFPVFIWSLVQGPYCFNNVVFFTAATCDVMIAMVPADLAVSNLFLSQGTVFIIHSFNWGTPYMTSCYHMTKVHVMTTWPSTLQLSKVHPLMKTIRCGWKLRGKS